MGTPIPVDVVMTGLDKAGPTTGETTSRDAAAFAAMMSEAVEAAGSGEVAGATSQDNVEASDDEPDEVSDDGPGGPDSGRDHSPAADADPAKDVTATPPHPDSGAGAPVSNAASETATPTPSQAKGAVTEPAIAPAAGDTAPGNAEAGDQEFRLSSLDLEGHDVRRFEIHTESAAQAAVGNSRPQIEPQMLLDGATPPANGPASLAASQAQDGGDAQTALQTDVLEGAVEEPVLPEVPQLRVAEAVSSLPFANGSRGAGDSSIVRHPKTAEASVTAADAVAGKDASPDEIVHMTSEVPQDMGDAGRGGESRMPMAPPPQPVKPLVPPTLALDPARRILMQLGESGSEVQVQIREHHGDVAIRLAAMNPVRGGLEASVQNLVDSLSREHVALSDLSFSNPSGGQSDSGHSRNGDGSRPNPGASMVTADVDDSGSTPEFETAAMGSRIRLTA